ncbi:MULTISPECIES: iron-containing alcohol dehydrogenase [unclassified Anaerobiospirillum]|uniref:iron-containing alcohol dehydrogenase n=1 Tax=unclassified Anaerobiospirillum TaxID=2647410 RepID=UPI001FF5123F|nr:MULTISPECIES: iron-containing alcohol dehydrogenase [unclassified Anaerobiospirillum]MCK0533711.1 iron-containing alcohol dehydrogenase [Anaerobiospirillum sp. NML120511]MCK0540045.1 iron-containing alcohol dehydrogenase [Anaerobiospirillum sp. NML02-A-032]
MENFDYQRRTFMMFGRARENEVGSQVKIEGGRRVLLHYGVEALDKPDLLDRIRRSLDRAGLEIFDLKFDDENEPSLDSIYRGIAFCRQHHIDTIVAIGRSNVINSGKVLSVGAIYNGDVLDFFVGTRDPAHSLALGALVTTPDAGAECSPVCTIVQIRDGISRKFTRSSPQFLPRFAILNPELSLSTSRDDTLLGSMDMITHVIECYFTNTQNVQITDELCEGLLRTILRILPQILEEPNNIEARGNLMLAGTLAQNGMCSLGREPDFALHALESALNAVYGTSHGGGLAVLIPAWLTYCLPANIMRMAQFANRVFGIPMNFDDPESTARSGINALRNFFSDCGLPQNFIDMGIPVVDVSRLVAELNLSESNSLGCYVKLDAYACESIYTIAYTWRPGQEVRRLGI